MPKAESDRQFQDELTDLIPFMRAFARSLCHDPAEADDIAQEALAKAWEARDRFTLGTNLRAWVSLILRNHFYSLKRRSWRSQPLDQDAAERTLVANDDPLATLQLDEVRRALYRLTPDQREALMLVAAGGLPYDEASEILCVPIGTIKSRVSRARDALALILAEGQLDSDAVPAHRAMPAIIAEIESLRSSPRAA